MPKYKPNRLILAGSENTYGTAATLTGADAVLCSKLEVEPLQLELVDRELVRGMFGNSPQIVARRAVRVRFDVELAGSGTAGTAPRWGSLLKACGRSETVVATTSVTYARVSSAFSSATLDFYNDGTRHLITGARGTATIGLTTDQIPTISFDMMGIFNAPTDTANPTPTYTLQVNPLAVNADNTPTVSVHSYSACMQEFSLEDGNEIVFRQLAGCSKEVMLPQRAPSGSVTIELPTLAAKNFFTIASNQTTGAITWTHGTVPGNIVTWNAPICDIGSPTFVDGDGVIHIQLPLRPLPTGNGNNEDTLVLT